MTHSDKYKERQEGPSLSTTITCIFFGIAIGFATGTIYYSVHLSGPGNAVDIAEKGGYICLKTGQQ